MKAITQDKYGSADVLQLRDVEQPAPGKDEVLVKVRAAGVDPGVWICMTGRPYAARAAFGLTKPKVTVRGRALAGVVAAVGADVQRFQPGDEVYGTSLGGTFAEYTVTSWQRLAPKPAALSFEQAAAVPISGVTALESVRDGGQVQPGQQVMIIGAAGGIGSFAVQIAAALGARVTGVCSAGKADLVRSLGAADVIDYARDEVDRDGPRYDVIIDTAGCRPLSLLRRALTPRGTLVLAGGGHDAGGLLGGYTRQLH
ncbi:MAG TPA: NAD(P)-dependent alcohol dehydrogenase, partial [Trebonia sp.]|nr:NAD(P)-dependent alcohol dehydrogenase [Trebonia sp.]